MRSMHAAPGNQTADKFRLPGLHMHINLYPALHADITPQIVVQAQIASHRSVPCVFLLGIYFDEDN